MRLPLFLKLMIPLVVLIVLAVGLSGYRIYQQADDRVQNDLNSGFRQTVELGGIVGE